MSEQPLTMQDLQAVIESAIVDDLQYASLTYNDICSRRHVGINRVVAVAKKYNLTRKRGRVPGRNLNRPVTSIR